MKRTRTIRVNGRSDLNLVLTFTVQPRNVTRQEQEHVVEALTDNLFDCLVNEEIPYHTVHASDVKIQGR